MMPRGGKLLSGEETVRLAVMDNVDREKLIAHIVDGLRVQQRARDSKMRKLNQKARREAR